LKLADCRHLAMDVIDLDAKRLINADDASDCLDKWILW